MRQVEQPRDLLLVVSQQAELVDVEEAPVARQKTQHGGFAMLRRHGRHADVDFRAGEFQTRCAVLRQPPLGDIQPRQDFYARDQRLRQNAGGRGHEAQQAVDAHAHGQPRAHRLDMDVGGAQFDRLFEQVADRPDDRRAARKIAQALDVVERAGGDAAALGFRRRFLAGQPLLENRGDILEGRDVADHVPQHDLRRADGGVVARIGDGEPAFAALALIGKDRHLAQEAGRKPLRQGRRGDQIGQRETLEIVEAGDLVGEFGGRELGRLPQLSQRGVGAAGLSRNRDVRSISRDTGRQRRPGTT